MKIWVEADGYGGVFVHKKEPEKWTSLYRRNRWYPTGMVQWFCRIRWCRWIEINSPKKRELQEIDLSGKKPRLVCTWVPA